MEELRFVICNGHNIVKYFVELAFPWTIHLWLLDVFDTPQYKLYNNNVLRIECDIIYSCKMEIWKNKKPIYMTKLAMIVLLVAVSSIDGFLFCPGTESARPSYWQIIF